jgi:diketogulonate reductase-like aldo/keto reductase
MPLLGLGVWQMAAGRETEQAVEWALEAGYRHIDTAALYRNEESVGAAVRRSGLPREQVFVTTKLLPQRASAERELAASLQRLQLDYVDLYLIHWPAPSLGTYVNSFGGMIQSRAEGQARSIGVSNFTDEHLTTVIDLTFVTPAVNQIELHPLLNQEALRKTNAEHNVLTQSYTPLALGKLNDNPTVNSVAGEYGKTASQVLLRWNLQLGNAVVFRSANAEHIGSNLDVFDFELADEHMDAINGLNDGTRLRPDPETYEGA